MEEEGINAENNMRQHHFCVFFLLLFLKNKPSTHADSRVSCTTISTLSLHKNQSDCEKFPLEPLPFAETK